jgi:hypothetical protein
VGSRKYDALRPEEHEQRRLAAQRVRDEIDAVLRELGAREDSLGVLRPFFDRHGTLVQIPTQRAKRLTLLDLLAQRFVPGQLYSEARVNLILGRFHPDWAALRRYLVDEEFLDRRDSMYWRAGGTFEVEGFVGSS